MCGGKFGNIYLNEMSFPGGSVVESPPANAGDMSSIPESGRFPWRRKWQPTPIFLPGKSHGQRSLEGYNPWGLKELDTTWQLNNNILNARYFSKCKMFMHFKSAIQLLGISYSYYN